MNFGAPEATAAVKPHRIKLEFPHVSISLHMNMWKLTTITRIEEKPVWTNSLDRWHVTK
jgi:hypothetical protein